MTDDLLPRRCKSCSSLRMSQEPSQLERLDGQWYYIQPAECYSCGADNTKSWMLVGATEFAEIARLKARVGEGVAMKPMSEAPCDGTAIEFRDDKGMYLGMGYWQDARWHRIGCRSDILAFTEVLAQAQNYTVSPALLSDREV